MDELEHWVQDAEQQDTARHPVLVHGDLHIRNITVDDQGKISGIIDWRDDRLQFSSSRRPGAFLSRGTHTFQGALYDCSPYALWTWAS
ncbi:phosphotransferase [Fictibacillus terranigra]|uniref:Phosphotransferase n=1 Tax=Fictibacillus terranigra TaxID=3058424 RepID=A0ABT8E8F8_9BACL|nr:phosphotransferase [Fictibacillus sp. CENA-BCM004]MDN4074203.1 phosphotransferase [Fictibacillus sp. CENA-BCM004]